MWGSILNLLLTSSSITDVPRLVGFYVNFNPLNLPPVYPLSSTAARKDCSSSPRINTSATAHLSPTKWIDLIQSDLFGRHQQTWPRQLVIQNCLEALYKLQQDYQHSNNLMEVISSTTLRPLKVSHLTKNPASGGPNLALPTASPALPARAVRPTRWIYLEVLLTDCQWWLLPVPVDSWFVSNFCELRCICLKKKGWWFVRVCCVTSYSLVVSYTHQHGMYHQ